MTQFTEAGESRKKTILSAAVGIAERDGYMVMKRDDIALAAGCATGSVHRYFDTMDNLRHLVMKHAIENGNMTVLGQGLAMKHPAAQAASKEMKKVALDLMG